MNLQHKSSHSLPALTSLIILIVTAAVKCQQQQLSTVCQSERYCRIYNLTSWREMRQVPNQQRPAVITLNGQPITPQQGSAVASLGNQPLTFAVPSSLSIPNTPNEYSGSNSVSRLILITTNSNTGAAVTVQCTYAGIGVAYPFSLQERQQANEYVFNSCDDTTSNGGTTTGRSALTGGSNITITAAMLSVDSGGSVDDYGKTRVSVVLTELPVSGRCFARPADSMIQLTDGGLTNGIVQQAGWQGGSSSTLLCSTLTLTSTASGSVQTTTSSSGSGGGGSGSGGDNIQPPDQLILGLSMPVLIGAAVGLALILVLLIGVSCLLYTRFYRVRSSNFYTSTIDGDGEKQLKPPRKRPPRQGADLNDEENRSGGDGGSRALFGGSYSDDLSFSQLHDSYPTMAQMISMQDLLMKRGSVGLSGYYLANHSRPHLAESVQRLTINPDDCTLMTGRAVIALPGFLKIDYHGDLRPARVVAEGGGGVVYEAELMNEHLQFKYQTKLVAVKLVKNPGSWTDEETLANFRQEVSIMWSLHEHPNIMPILGYTEEPMGIVMPYYAFGMMDIIRGKQCEQILTDDNVLRYIHQLASAMQTMHHLNIVHRDLKTQNLLVDAPAGSDPMFWRVILSDFGLSKPLESGGVEAAVYTNAIGLSYRYAAPELFGRMQQMNASRMSILIAANQQNSNLAPEGWIEKKADCFAFAIIMWEIFERSPSWPTNSNAEIEENVVSLGLRPPFIRNNQPTTELQTTLKSLIEQCWPQQPKDRLSFDQIMEKLQPVADKLPRPPELTMLSSSANNSMIGANAAEIIGSYNNAANGGNISRSQMIASLRSAGSLYGSHGGSAFIPTNRPRVNTIGYYQPQQMPSQVTTRDQRLQHTKSLRQALPDSFMTSSQSADNLVKRNS